MNSLLNILDLFDPISLKEMDHAKLMNRKEFKYLIDQNTMMTILHTLNRSYRLLQIENQKLMSYESLYFDTNQYNLFSQHHAGRLNRYKLRYRRYIESNQIFLELKFKNNKNRTIKNRIETSNMNVPFTTQEITFISNNSNLNINHLEPNLTVYYSRITLVNIFYPERITIDCNLRFKLGTCEYEFGDYFIAEVKYEAKFSSDFVNQMNLHRVKEGFISKYCLGICKLIPSVKQNNFKTVIKNIKS